MPRKFGSSGAGPLVVAMDVAAGRVGLPDLDAACCGTGAPDASSTRPGDDDPLADRLAAGAGVAGEVGVLRRDRADRGPGPGELRERQRHLDQRQRRRAADASSGTPRTGTAERPRRRRGRSRRSSS